jgi:hypothetical protein
MMTRVRRLTLAAAAVAAVLVVPAATPAVAGGPTGSDVTAGARLTDACAPLAATAVANCLAVVRSDRFGVPLATPGPAGFGPSDLRSAYQLPSTTAGAGHTVAIVDAFDDPNAETDLAVYRSQYGLPPCTTANGCFRKLDQRGGTQYPPADSSWAIEESLEIDMV